MALPDARARFAGWIDVLPHEMSEKAPPCSSGGDLPACVERVIILGCITVNFPMRGAT